MIQKTYDGKTGNLLSSEILPDEPIVKTDNQKLLELLKNKGIITQADIDNLEKNAG